MLVRMVVRVGYSKTSLGGNLPLSVVELDINSILNIDCIDILSAGIFHLLLKDECHVPTSTYPYQCCRQKCDGYEANNFHCSRGIAGMLYNSNHQTILDGICLGKVFQ
jgi:hypothetical protein